MTIQQSSPRVIVLGGPNGAGKTSSSRKLLAETLKVLPYVNADVIAQGLSGFAPESVAWEASRIMLERLHALANRRETFALETTLAGRSYFQWLRSLRESGYQVNLYYFYLSNADLALQRVALRVQRGGHSIPESTIRTRYRRSLLNLFSLYLSIADEWTIFDNTGNGAPVVIARGQGEKIEIFQQHVWAQMNAEFHHD